MKIKMKFPRPHPLSGKQKIQTLKISGNFVLSPSKFRAAGGDHWEKSERKERPWGSWERFARPERRERPENKETKRPERQTRETGESPERFGAPIVFLNFGMKNWLLRGRGGRVQGPNQSSQTRNEKWNWMKNPGAEKGREGRGSLGGSKQPGPKWKIKLSEK